MVEMVGRKGVPNASAKSSMRGITAFKQATMLFKLFSL
jgi:hypothetical protein